MKSQQDKNNQKAKKGAIILGAVGLFAASLITMQGLYSAPEVLQTGTMDFNAGTFQIDLTPGQSVTAPGVVSNMAAGDVNYSFFRLTNKSQAEIGELVVTPKATGELFANPNSAQISLIGCDEPFVNGKCNKGEYGIMKDISNNTASSLSKAIAANGTTYLRIETKLAKNLGNDKQGKNGQVSYTFRATQKDNADTLPQPESN